MSIFEFSKNDGNELKGYKKKLEGTPTDQIGDKWSIKINTDHKGLKPIE